MKKYTLFASLFIIISLLSACAPAGETVLTVGDQTYSQADLEALGSQSVDYTNKDGEVSAFTGVPLAALLENAGVANNGENITFAAADNYAAEASAAEVLACTDCIIAFDNGSLRLVMPDFSGKLQVRDLIKISVE